MSSVKAIKSCCEESWLSLVGQIRGNASVCCVKGINKGSSEGSAYYKGACCAPEIIETLVFVSVIRHESELHFII